jgi:hypothetical protein
MPKDRNTCPEKEFGKTTFLMYEQKRNGSYGLSAGSYSFSSCIPL